MITNSSYINNRNKIYSKLQNGDVVVLFSATYQQRNGNQFFKYRQNSDILYLSGITQENTILLFYKHLDSIEEFAFVIEPTEHTCIWTGVKLNKTEVSEISGIKNVEYLEKFDEISTNIIRQTKGKIYLSFANNIRHSFFENYEQKTWKEKIKSTFQNIEFQNIDPIISDYRLQKDEYEIENIKKALKITQDTFNEILTFVKPCIYEYEVEAEIYKHIKSKNAELAYQPVIAAGKNNCILQSIKSLALCNAGDLLLLDFGAEVNGYASDITRTIPISGKYNKRQKEVYNSLLNVLNQLKSQYTPGKTIREIQLQYENLLLDEIIKLNLANAAIKSSQEESHKAIKKYSQHIISHFIGLDVHDVGNRDTVFENRMVLSCEPALYIPEENFGIRLETDIFVHQTPIDLGKDITIYANEIETQMNKKLL